jgi:hypothetical protein
MLLRELIKQEMDEEEFEFLYPRNFETIEGYFFEIENTWKNGNFTAYIVLPDDREVKITYYNDTGKIRYDKCDAYASLHQDATAAYPDDSCAIDTFTAFLQLVDAKDWDDWDD